MKKFTALCACLLVLGMTAVSFAEDGVYDLAEYWMLTPGKWVTGTDSLGIAHRTETIAIGNDTVAQLHYITLPGVGTFLGSGVALSVLENSILIHMELVNDATPELVDFNPVIAIPRYVKDGTYVTYTGDKTGGTAKLKEFFVFYVDEVGLTVTTPAGTFNDCIKISTTRMDDELVSSYVAILAKGVGFLKQYSTLTYGEGETLTTSAHDIVTNDFSKE